MNDVPHQWILDKLTALCLMGEMDKEEVDRFYALFVQRFPDEVAEMKTQLRQLRRMVEVTDPEFPIDEAMAKLRDLEQEGDNYVTESANE